MALARRQPQGKHETRCLKVRSPRFKLKYIFPAKRRGARPVPSCSLSRRGAFPSRRGRDGAGTAQGQGKHETHCSHAEPEPLAPNNLF